MSASTRLAVLSVAVAVGAVASYALLLRVAAVRNHPEGYVFAFALATALASLAVARARVRRWRAWLALGLCSLLLVAGAWFNFVVARVPDSPSRVAPASSIATAAEAVRMPPLALTPSRPPTVSAIKATARADAPPAG